jgi:hypothetical protein
MTYYDWLDKVMLLAPESDIFYFRDITNKITQDSNGSYTLATWKEIAERTPSCGYTAEDLFMSLWSSEFINDLSAPAEYVDLSELKCSLTDKGRELKKIGNWFAQPKRNIRK